MHAGTGFKTLLLILPAAAATAGAALDTDAEDGALAADRPAAAEGPLGDAGRALLERAAQALGAEPGVAMVRGAQDGLVVRSTGLPLALTQAHPPTRLELPSAVGPAWGGHQEPVVRREGLGRMAEGLRQGWARLLGALPPRAPAQAPAGTAPAP